MAARSSNIANLVEKHGRSGSVTFIDEPDPEELFCPLISVDDHVLEPPTVFQGRMPSKFADVAPRVEYDDTDVPWWLVDGKRLPILFPNGAAGRVMREWKGGSRCRYDEFRLSVSDPIARLADMDLTGVWASLCFGSTVWGFAGTRFSRIKDPELGYAALRAYNDWMIEDWCATDRLRFIPCQLPWLADPSLAAAEIRRNAERGFRAVSFSENPEGLGFPSIYDEHWDPFLRACAETETVVNLHVGSSGRVANPSADSPPEVVAALFPISGIETVIDWIYARVPLRHPDIKIVPLRSGRVVGPDGHRAPAPGPPLRARVGGLVGRRPEPDRPAPSQLLLRLGGGPRRLPDPRPHRRRPRDGGDGLPAHGQHLAGLPVDGPRRARAPAPRADPHGLLRERRAPVPPPAASRRPDRPSQLRRMRERFSIAGRRALITGASQGIGRMIAAGYVDAGATVYACSRNEEACRSLEKELSTRGRCIALPGDVSTEAGCRAIADALHGYEDRLDILVNNAGAAAMAPIDSFGDEVWDEVLSVNLKGPFYLVRFLLPLLRAASGPDDPARVINIGSISALRMQDMDNYAYTASKAALHTLTRQLARRLAPSVTVNAIVPGPFPSLMMADVLEKHGEAMAAASPMKRIGRDDDIAGAAIFLASPAAAWMTGTTMILDGGLSTT